jgi:hypothetical protein
MNTWTTKDERELLFSDIADSHLLNIYKMLLKDNSKDKNNIIILTQKECIARKLDTLFPELFI